jgi:uncharacterized membrane protein YfcA
MFIPLFLVIIYLFVGFFAGLMGGLLGVGGGAITVPAFFVIFSLVGYPKEYLMPLSVGTSLAAMVFTTLSATWSHHKHYSVVWPFFKKMALGLILGSLFGAFLTLLLPEKFLEIFFGVFLCSLSVIFFRDKLPIYQISEKFSSLLLRASSLAIGTLSSLLGIGGGVITVPLLISIKTPDKNAIGTSSSITLLVSFMGTISYILFGWKHHLSSHNLGYIDIPAFLIVGITTFFAAPLGVKLTHQLSLKKIRMLFAGMLLVTGLTFIILNLLSFFR